MVISYEVLWRPLLEAAAQTIVGAIGGYVFTEMVRRATEQNSFDGAMDLWRRGIRDKVVGDGDHLVFDGLISPYTQLFPGDPMDNGTRWNQLYAFQGKISNDEFQAMEFFAGSDAALRIGSLNGETLVGLYARYGFVGEGIIGVVPTRVLRKALPDFFHPDFYGVRARIYGRLALCPAQHGFVAQAIAQRSGIGINLASYRNIYYLQVSKIIPAVRASQKTCSLLGSAWALTESNAEQYLVQYGYISEPAELSDCNRRILSSSSWDATRVFYDELNSPSAQLGFKKNFIS